MSNEQKELMKALEDFKNSAYNLLLVWESTNEDLNENYPFKESFEEVVTNIFDWSNSNIKEEF